MGSFSVLVETKLSQKITQDRIQTYEQSVLFVSAKTEVNSTKR